ncbi:MAG: NADAR family protein [Rhodanobacteraceae bacterium]|nr:NADAR family protein [Rhodanobacteraceae bacterium]
MDTINFYRTSDDFGEFSNFSAHPIKLDGVRWPTSEHYFQAQKFHDAAYRERIRNTHSPMEAANLGRDRRQKLRGDWESVKVEVMRKALRAKFTQHDELTALLLSTGDATLVEHTTNDSYWGDGGDGRGRNMLGQLLMQLRDELQKAKP